MEENANSRIQDGNGRKEAFGEKGGGHRNGETLGVGGVKR